MVKKKRKPAVRKRRPITAAARKKARAVAEALERPASDEEELLIEDDVHDNVCSFCGDFGDLICCDTCKRAFHLLCTQPLIDEIPEGMWQCHFCEENEDMTPLAARTADDDAEDDGDEDDDDDEYEEEDVATKQPEAAAPKYYPMFRNERPLPVQSGPPPQKKWEEGNTVSSMRSLWSQFTLLQSRFAASW